LSKSAIGGTKLVSRHPHLYISVTHKFVLSTLIATTWFAISLWLAQGWISDLSAEVGTILAHVIILLIALIPGFLNAHIVSSVVLDSPPPLPTGAGRHMPPISVLIAAYNEEDNLPDTLSSIAAQDYPGAVEVVVVDDGSTDGTLDVLGSADMSGMKVVRGLHRGKAAALTLGLDHVTQELVVCIDADTLLHPQALKRIVARMLSAPSDTVAVAGSVLVRNSRTSFMTRVQEWDYFIGIASAKRQQGLYQNTLVAQDAFSAFRTAALQECGG